MRQAPYLSALVLLATACNQNPIETPVRSFDRPSDVAMTCVVYDPTADGKDSQGNALGLWRPRELASCAPKLASACKPAGTDPDEFLDPADPTGTTCFRPELRVLVANSARGEVALVNVPRGVLIDLDGKNPGFNFIPVGRLPESIRASADGCLAVTANANSCDLGLVNLPTMYNMPFVPNRGPERQDFAKDVVRRVELWAGGKRLEARPTAIELTSLIDRPGTNTTCEDNAYHAWIALPGCEAVVEATLRLQRDVTAPLQAQITRAIRVGRGGAQLLADPSQLNCPAECSGGEAPVDAPASMIDPLAPGGRLPQTQAAPATLAIDVEDQAQRLAIGDYYGERVSLVTLDPVSGAPSAPRAITLEAGALGVHRLRISPRSPAGKFLYAIARDGTARVVDLDRELECETNPDATELRSMPPEDPSIDARRLGCLPLGDPSTPRRSASAIGPGIALPNGALARDVAFVHLDTPSPPLTGAPFSAQPQLLVGDFAWLVGSDGRASVVTLFDACPQPNDPQDPEGDGTYTQACAIDNALASRRASYASNFGNPYPTELERVSHRLRLGSRRFLKPNNIGDSAGTPRVQDPTNPLTVSVEGSPAKVGPGFRLPRLEPAIRAIQSLLPGDAPAGYSQLIEVPDPRLARDETWTLAWEGALPGTLRAYGRVCGVDDPTCPRGSLVDSGAAWCARGIVAGDKLELLGCDKDEDCVYSQECVRDSAAPTAVRSGLCLDRGANAEQAERCSSLLRATRRYRITAPRQGITLGSGVTTDLLDLAEIYEPEFKSQTKTCDPTKTFAEGEVDTECGGVVIPAPGTVVGRVPLATRCMEDVDGVARCLRPCTLDGPSDTGVCGKGYLCAETNRSTAVTPDFRCMRAPLDVGLFTDCLKRTQRYQVRAGESFSVIGSGSGLLSDLEPDPLTRECQAPPVSAERVRLRSPRLPLEAPRCTQPLDPALGVDVLSYLAPTEPNACRYETGDEDRLLHFENPILSFALRLANNATGHLTGYVPEDETLISFGVAGGGFPLGLVLGVSGQPAAQAPRTAVVAPDRQTVFVVDEGKGTTSTSLRGQLLRLVSAVQICDPAFRVR